LVFFRGAEKRLKAAKALKEKGETPEELLQSIKENEAAVAEAQRTVDAWKAIVGEKSRREEASKAEAERKAAEERERAEEERDRIEAELDAQKADEEACLEAERKAEEEAVEKDAELKEDKKKPQLKDVVKAIYEKGKSAASRLYKMAFFDVAKTPDFMKKLGLTGDRFTIKYGVLSRHAGKDDSHSLTEKQWEELPDALQKPFAITRFGGKDKGYRLYTTMKNENGETIVVGVDVKNVGRDMEVNAISTIFGRRGDAKKTQKEDVLYTAENITPEQRSLLGQPNSDQYTGVRERNVSTDKGSEKPEKKQENESVFDKAKEIADKEEKKRKAEADKPKQKPLTETERKDAEEVAGALGYRVEWVDTMEENGTIDADKKVIRIAKDAENPLVQVLGHEVAHGVRRMIGGKFRALQKAAMEVAGEKEWNERIEKKRKLNAYAEGKLAEEVTCDIVGEALNDKDALKRLAESLRGEKGILARLRDAVAKMVEYFKNRGDKEGVRRMKAADRLLAEFESALKEGEGVNRSAREAEIENENVERSVRKSRSEKAESTAEERELRDNLVERMRKGGLDVVTDSEEMQRVIDTENERTRMMGAGSVREHRVYHGSGADFDAFDHSHMGEGEGAQAYGWGTYVTEVEGIGRTYAIQNTTKHNDALRALQHDVDAISDQLNRQRDDLKYDEEQLKRANEWRAEAELDYELFKNEAEELKEKYGEASPKYRNHLFNDIYTDEMKRAQSSVKSTEESIQYRKEKIAELEKALKDK
jgi:hypothetical protein